VWLVHDAEDDLGVVDVARCKLVPEGLELCGGCGSWVGRVTNDGASEWLRRWVIVTHVYKCQEVDIGVIKVQTYSCEDQGWRRHPCSR